MRVRIGVRLTLALALALALALSPNPNPNPNPKQLRVACIGGTQAGKSTLVAVLAAGTLDNGHGSARTSVMRHPHELESGSTSCISQQVLGFDAQVRAGLR